MTPYDFKEEMPFPRNPVILELTGKDLLYGVEEMLRHTPAHSGAFPQFSAGVNVEYFINNKNMKK
eukprot:UN18378